jgi:hypothetical protein
MNATLLHQLNRLQRLGLLAGVLGFGLCVAGWLGQPRQFFASYLFSYTFWLGLSLGCLGVAMIHYLVGGRWGFATRRFLEAGFLTLPVMAVLFVPLLFGLRELYPWAQPGVVAASELLRQKQVYLNPTGHMARAAFYFLVWIALAVWLRKWSVAQDGCADAQPTFRLRALSGPGIVLYPLTATFAFVDWVMSLEPAWHSTMFAVIVLIGQVLTALALGVVMLAWFERQAPFAEVVTPRHFHDLGNLLLAFVVFWTYVSFGQLLVIYSGNLPQEIDWYLHHIGGRWRWVVVGLAVFHFFVPFFLLLFRSTKLRVGRLATIAALLLGAHVAADFWLIAPTFHPADLQIHWLDGATLMSLGGVWLTLFVAHLKKAALLPSGDPRFATPLHSPAHAR